MYLRTGKKRILLKKFLIIFFNIIDITLYYNFSKIGHKKKCTKYFIILLVHLNYRLVFTKLNKTNSLFISKP